MGSEGLILSEGLEPFSTKIFKKRKKRRKNLTLIQPSPLIQILKIDESRNMGHLSSKSISFYTSAKSLNLYKKWRLYLTFTNLVKCQTGPQKLNTRCLVWVSTVHTRPVTVPFSGSISEPRGNVSSHVGIFRRVSSAIKLPEKTPFSLSLSLSFPNLCIFSLALALW